MNGDFKSFMVVCQSERKIKMAGSFIWLGGILLNLEVMDGTGESLRSVIHPPGVGEESAICSIRRGCPWHK